MMVRKKAFSPGDTVKLHEVVSHPLPRGIGEGQLATVIAKQSGSVRVQTSLENSEDEIQFWIPLVNVDAGEEYFLDGRWLDGADRRVRKRLARAHVKTS